MKATYYIYSTTIKNFPSKLRGDIPDDLPLGAYSLKIVWQPDEKTREMREVFFAHRAAVKDCTRLRNRIRTFLTEHCIRLPKGTQLTQQSDQGMGLEAPSPASEGATGTDQS